MKVSTRYQNNCQLNIAMKNFPIESRIVTAELIKNMNQLIIQSITVPIEVPESQSGKLK